MLTAMLLVTLGLVASEDVEPTEVILKDGQKLVGTVLGQIDRKPDCGNIRQLKQDMSCGYIFTLPNVNCGNSS